MNILEKIFSKPVANFKRERVRTDVVISEWIANNKSTYSDFMQRIENVAINGDMSILYDIYNLMRRCIPPEALGLYGWIADTLSGEKSSLTQNKQWAGRYTKEIDQCWKNKHLWLGVNLKSGEVKTYFVRPSNEDLLLISSGTPDEIWNKLPTQVKSHLIGLIDDIADNSKKTLGVKIERKQLRDVFALMGGFVVLSHAAFVSGFLANLYDEVIEKKEPLTYCVYYFVVFDSGLTCMANILNQIMQSEDVDTDGLIFINTCISWLVGSSMEMRLHTKEDWDKVAKTSNDEIRKEIALAISKFKSGKGNKARITSLDKLLNGNVDKLKKLIKKFMKENTATICLAYLLIALQRSGCIQQGCKYMTFHRAIESFMERRISYNVPQKRYGELKERPLSVEQYSIKDSRAKKIIDEWTPVFSRASV